MNNDVLLLTETQLSLDSDLNEIIYLLDRFMFSFSSLTICHQNSAYRQRYQKGDGISTIVIYNSSDGIRVALM